MKSKFFWILIFVLATTLVIAQNTTAVYEWGGVIGPDVTGTPTLKIYDMDVDASGNIYTTGTFKGTLDFDQSAGIVNLTSAGGTQDIFFAKYNSAGVLQWAKKIGGSNVSGDEARAIAIDASSNVYITGYYYGVVDFDPGAGIFNLDAGTPTKGDFFAKYNNSGDLVWAKSIYVAYNITDIEVDASNNVYIAGFGGGGVIMDMDPGAGTININSPVVNSLIFFAKYNSLGDHIFSKALKGTGTNLSINNETKLGLDSSGSLIIFGSGATQFGVNGSIDFDPTAADYSLNIGSSTTFLAKYSTTDGALQWANLTEGGSSLDLKIGSDNKIYICGQTFAPSTDSGFFSKYDTDGTVIFTKPYSITSSGGAVITGIDVNSSNEIFVNGNYSAYPATSVDIDPNTAIFSLPNTQYYRSTFLSKFNNTGNLLWAKSIANGYFSNRIAINGSNIFLTFPIYHPQYSYQRRAIDLDIGPLKDTADYDFGAAIVKFNEVSITNQPTAQPTNLVFSNVQDVSATVSWTAATGSPAGYVVVRRANSLSAGFYPQDGYVYAVGDTIGVGRVVYVGNGLTFNEAGLTPHSEYYVGGYYYDVFSYLGSGQTTNYREASPLSGVLNTLNVEPTDQPTNLQFSNINATTIGFKYSPTTQILEGNGLSYVLVLKGGSQSLIDPVDGEAYTNASIGSNASFYFLNSSTMNVKGDALVADLSSYGSATAPILVSNLNPGTTYYFKIYSYSNSTAGKNYKLVSPLAGSQVTMPAEPGLVTNITATNLTTTSWTINFDPPTGGSTGYVVLKKPACSWTNGALTDGTVYAQGGQIDPGEIIIYKGTGTSFNDSGLSSNAQYCYRVFGYNGASSLTNYGSYAQLNRYTLTNEPAAQPTSINFTSVTTNTFTVAYAAASGSPAGYLVVRKAGATPTGIPVDGTNYGVNDILGDGTIAYVGNLTTFPQSSLTSGTTYYYAIYSYNGTFPTGGATYNYLTTSPLTGSQSTLLGEPSNSPLGPVLFSNATPTSLHVEFSAAPGGADGYLAMRRAGASPTGVPIDATAYTEEVSNIGDGRVAYIGATPSFDDTGLLANTVYYYDIFSYNGSGSLLNYKTSTPLEGSRTTLAADPTASASAMSFASVTTTSYQVNYVAATGTPTGYLVLRKLGSSPTGIPIDGATYSISNQIGDGEVVYLGGGTTFPQTSLTEGTAYFYDVFSYNGSGLAINYREVSPLEGSQITPITSPANQPTSLSFTAVTTNSISASFLAAAGAPTGYLVVSKSVVSPAPVLTNNVDYTVGQTLSDGSKVVSKGSMLSFIESSLASSTTYHYDVYSYNQIGSLISYRTTLPLEGNATTFTGEPSAQPSGLVFSLPTSTSLRISFTAASPAPGSYLAIRKTGSTPTFIPQDGNDYALGSTQGDSYVAYKGSAITFDDSNLLPGTAYYYAIFSFNGSGASTNFLSTVNASNSGNKITVPDKPAGSVASSVAQNSFRANWQATIGAISYRLDVSSDNFVTRIAGFDDLIVSGIFTDVTGLQPGTVYKYQVRAVNGSGVSVSSDPIQQFTIPPTPTTNNADPIGQTTFTAKWNSVVGATDYFIDVSADDFVTFATGFGNKSTGLVTSSVITGLNPGLLYKYRVRSSNSGGSSANSNPPTEVLLIPATPVGSDPTLIQSTSFKANWQGVVGADEYRVDVSLASTNFNPSLQGFTNFAVVGNTELLVTNLNPATDYLFRVRAINASGSSPNSASKAGRTTDAGAGNLSLATPTFTPGFTGTDSDVAVRITAGVPPFTVKFHYRPILATNFTVIDASLVSSLNYKATVNSSMVDELGIEFFFSVVAGNNQSDQTDKRFIYNVIPSGGIKIPFAKSGGDLSSYEIFSIPYQLESDLVAQIFEELGVADKAKWRLVRFQGGKNVDLSTASKIEPGKGYWFNRKEKIDVSFSNGTVVQRNQTSPFEMTLESGWNQIGNPYLFNIDWDDILSVNSSVANSIGNLKIYNASALHLNDESNNLKAWSGGFVHNDSDQSIKISLPVTLKTTAGGRKSDRIIVSTDLNQPDWFLPINIMQGELENHYTGVGMHPEAHLLKDRFDDIVAPRFINYLEFYSYHADYFSPKFAQDVVPTANSFVWDFDFASNMNQEAVTMHWNNEDFGANEAQLLLFDVSNNNIVNMRISDHYQFVPQRDQHFKILFGINKSAVTPDIDMLGHAYPNPFSSGTSIPYVIKQSNSKVSISIVDVMGRSVSYLLNTFLESGVYEAKWNGTNESGDVVAPGLYLCRVEINGRVMTERIIKR